MPIDKLIKVGSSYVPQGHASWKFAVKNPVLLVVSNINDQVTPSSNVFETILYSRVQTITGVIYVANVVWPKNFR